MGLTFLEGLQDLLVVKTLLKALTKDNSTSEHVSKRRQGWNEHIWECKVTVCWLAEGVEKSDQT